uniref:SHSP domain-containing protein n=1 Tax=Ditylenchus dipsaci TaxID=166011 RepID=A0A915EW99_9BILA
MSIEVTHDWTGEQWDWPLQHNDGVVKVQNLGNKWEVGLDAQFFTPKEIEVKVLGDHLVVNCSHDERSDQHGNISRQISRSYKLPDDVDTSTITSHLTPHGRVVVVGSEDSAYAVQLKVREMHQLGVTHLIGAFDQDLDELLQHLVCETSNLTYIRVLGLHRWSISEYASHPFNRVLDMFPKKAYFNMLENLLKYWKWEDRFSIVYMRSQGVHQYAELFSIPITLIFIEVDDTKEDFNPSSIQPYLDAGLKLRKLCTQDNCERKLNRAVLGLPHQETMLFLRAALMLGMININYWYFLTSIDDLSDSHIDPLRHNMVRLTTTNQFNRSLLSTDSKYFQAISTFQHIFSKENPEAMYSPLKDFVVIHDAILWMMKTNENLTVVTNVKGLSGPIRFNNHFQRLDASFLVSELSVNGSAIYTGVWRTNSEKLQTELSMKDKSVENTHESRLEESRTQRFIRVTSILEKPYDLNFEYQFSIVADGQYGDEKKSSNNSFTGQWNGMIGEILAKEADVAVAPITITASRLEVVDFTDPFLQLGISMLMRQPKEKTSSFLSFLWPLSPTVWSYSAILTLGSALSICLNSVLSPSESSSVFNIMNSLWYLLCILLRAGSGYNCRSISNRLMSAIWWMFTLILIAQYTANFAAVLTIDRKTLPFNSFEELGNQTEYSFGAIAGGSTQQFFMYSRLETFRNIWLRMSNMSTAFVKSNDQGVQKAINEKYVFLMESTSLEYQLTQHCNLSKVGNIVLGSNGYSLALPKGSRWREQLSRTILEYNERGLKNVKRPRWKQKENHWDWTKHLASLLYWLLEYLWLCLWHLWKSVL